MQQPHPPSGRIRPLLRIEYDQLVDLGAFGDERIQLLEGELVQMSPQKERHAGIIRLLTRFFVLTLGDRYDVSVQLPLAATDDSEPEPDLAIHPRGNYLVGHPTRAHLVIEVSGDTLRLDLGVKARIYARAGVPEYWVVDLKKSEVVVHRRPDRTAASYGSIRRIRPEKHLVPLKFPRLKVPIEILLPPTPKH